MGSLRLRPLNALTRSACRVVCGARPGEVLLLFCTGRYSGPSWRGCSRGARWLASACGRCDALALALDLPFVDPVALAAAVGLLFTAGLMATAIPAMRAALEDPWSMLER